MKKTILAVLIGLLCGSAAAQNFETSAQTQLKQGGVNLVQQRNILGQGVRIGIVDQGFDLSHRDFLGKIVASRNFYSGSAVTWGVHGTAMAGVAAAANNGVGTVGVAPAAQLLLAQVGAGGTNTVMTESAVYRAVDWLSANRADVINLSLGAQYTTNFTQTTQRSTITGIYFASSMYGANYSASATEINNYKLATDRGSIIVAAAGNQGLGYSEFPGMYATRTDANGRLVLDGRMIIVGAVDANNVMASFSDRAGHICQNSVGLNCKDTYLTREFYVVAPGVNVVVSQANQLTGGKNLATTMSGTSPAAAYVSGGMALMRQTWPQLRPEQLVALVLNTTRDLGAPGVDNVYGRGLVDFDRATRPQGALTLANKQALVGQAGNGVSLSVTGAAMSSGLAQVFRSTSLVQNTQVIDGIGRNYAANLTEAIRPLSLTNYSPDSPWLSFAGFQQARLPIATGLNLTVMTAQNGIAIQTNAVTEKIKYSVQLGSMTEQSGFLGNRGTGGTGLGSSSSNWTMFGIEIPVSDATAMITQLGYGQTMIVNDPMSMIDLDPKILSRTWRLGFRTGNFTMTTGIPVSIYNGQARVTGVVGYSYEDTQDQTIAHPIIRTEKVDLKLPVQEYNIVANYRQALTKSSVLNYNLVQRFNVGGVAGTQATFAGVNFTWIQ